MLANDDLMRESQTVLFTSFLIDTKDSAAGHFSNKSCSSWRSGVVVRTIKPLSAGAYGRHLHVDLLIGL